MATTSETTRLSSLDALRGIAALAVAVFSHFQHFGGDKKTYPFNDVRVANWLYENSWLFVDFFFLLSGIVLTYRYYQPLAKQEVSAKEFFLLRVSRLYPLHLAMLCVCAAVEWTLQIEGKPQVIYQHNDLYHFVLNLFYLHWGWFEEGLSYDAPSWSVCAEVSVYVLFFVFLRYPKRYLITSVLTIFTGLAVIRGKIGYPFFNENIARAMIGFFLGSLMYLGMIAVGKAGYGRALTRASLLILIVMCGLTYEIGYAPWIGGTPIHNSTTIFPIVILVAMRVRPVAWVLSLRPLTFLGDISYSIYLVHVPMQMIVLAYCASHKIPIDTTSPRLLYVYFVAVIVVATLTHYGIERPARTWFRNRSKVRAAAPAPTQPPAAVTTNS